MKSAKPKISILLATYNRPSFLRASIRSVVMQTMTDWELLVINDGGADVRTVVDFFKDARIQYYKRSSNRGQASCFNFGLERSRGTYIAHIDDDDLWYPDHLQTLIKEIEICPHLGGVYSSLYQVRCVSDSSGKKRFPVDKFICSGRPYSRNVMLCTNIAPHVSVIHRKELVCRAGGYNESVTVLTDWNINRKISFFADFKYVPGITGEFYTQPESSSDRVSDRERKSRAGFQHNIRLIKSDLPEGPWPMIDSIAVVYPVSSWDPVTAGIITGLFDSLFYPVRFYIINNTANQDESLCRRYLGSLGTLQNIHILTPPRIMSERESYVFGAERARADYVYLPTKAVDTKLQNRIISARSLLQDGYGAATWDVPQEKSSCFDVLLPKSSFLKCCSAEHIQNSISVKSVSQQPVREFTYDYCLSAVGSCCRRGEFSTAYHILLQAESANSTGIHTRNWIETYYRTCVELGKTDELLEKLHCIIENGYGADNWIRVGRLLQGSRRFREAVYAYRNGMSETGLSESQVMSSSFPCISCTSSAYEAYLGMGECLLQTGSLASSARMFSCARKLNTSSSSPLLGMCRVFLSCTDTKNAALALRAARNIKPDCPEAAKLHNEIVSMKSGRRAS